ncbi:MAG: cytochrome C oxidase subunit IV family protein [Chloroflexi bacterium]|nr:cytochrome C oxidase subunit IV family protein [Chloroflexota bacterium]
MHGEDHALEHPHPTARTYVTIAAVLTAITALEVTAIYIQALAGVLVPILLLLSASKFLLVAMFYMHLKFDSRLFAGFFVSGLAIAASLIIALLALFHQGIPAT